VGRRDDGVTSAIEDGWTKLRPFTRKLRGFRMTCGSDPFDHKQSAGPRSRPLHGFRGGPVQRTTRCSAETFAM